MAGKYDNKFLDAEGVKYLWDKAEGIYIKKEEGKSLSDENFTTAEKEKLAGLTAYQLPNASADTLGGVKIGTGLSIDASGVVSATGEVEAEVETLSFTDLDFITKTPTSEESLRALIAEGGDIILTKDLTITEPIDIVRNTTIDLGGHTLTAEFNDYLFTVTSVRFTLLNGSIQTENRIAQVISSGSITIASGTYTSNDVAFAAVGIDSRITVNSGMITGSLGGIGLFDGAQLTINGGNITARNNFGVYTTGSDSYGHNNILINGGTIVGQTNTEGKASCGVLIANNDTLVMTGGNIISENGCGLLMRSGVATINDGSIVSSGVDSGSVGDDNTIVAHSAIIFDHISNYPGKQLMELTINDGEFVGVQYSIQILSNDAHPPVNINGGHFNPANF